MPPAAPPPRDHPGLTADALLASPRGRSLCLQLLGDRLPAAGQQVEETWLDALDAARAGDSTDCARKLSESTRNADVDGTPFDDSALLAALEDVVSGAVSWAEPEEEDRGSAAAAARDGLRPVAEAVAAAAGSAGLRWWSEPGDLAGQRETPFLGPRPQAEPQLAGTAGAAAAWRADAVAGDLPARGRPGNPR